MVYSLCRGRFVGCFSSANGFLCVCVTGKCSMERSMFNDLYNSEMFLAADGAALFDFDQVPHLTLFILIVCKESLALTDILQGNRQSN